jgi:hypothetical protein
VCRAMKEWRFKNILFVYDDAVGGDDVLGQGAALSERAIITRKPL